MVDQCPHVWVVVGLGVLEGPLAEVHGNDGEGRGCW